MTTSEPTTVEIVRALRVCASEEAGVNCDVCPYDRCDSLSCLDKLQSDAADRLESQEQTISALTARAEQAELERDAAVEMRNNAMRGVEGIKRGQQDGEGK